MMFAAGLRALALLSLALVTVFATPALAQFYKGKTVTILINFTPGGPTDIEGRIIGRHLGKHTAGNPTVIVKNMGGGNGATGTNFLGEVAAKDGLTLGFFTWNPLDQVLGSEGLRVRFEKFELVGGVEQPQVIYVRKDVPPGLAKPADIAKVTHLNAGSSGTQSPSVLRMSSALDLLGVKYKLVSGYRGAKEVETAVLQNEVQLTSNSLPGYRGSTEAVVIKSGIALPLFHYDVVGEGGKLVPSPALPDVPSYLQLYREIHGADKMPSGIKWEALLFMNSLMDSMYRTIFLPPGTPKQAVDAMRAAFASLWKDEAFQQEYEKTVKSRAALVSGDDGARIIAGLGTVKPEIVDHLKKYVAELAAR